MSVIPRPGPKSESIVLRSYSRDLPLLCFGLDCERKNNDVTGRPWHLYPRLQTFVSSTAHLSSPTSDERRTRRRPPWSVRKERAGPTPHLGGDLRWCPSFWLRWVGGPTTGTEIGWERTHSSLLGFVTRKTTFPVLILLTVLSDVVYYHNKTIIKGLKL